MTYSHSILALIASSAMNVSTRPFLGLRLYQQREAANDIAVALRSHLGCADPLPVSEEDARVALATAHRDYRASEHAPGGFPAAMTRVMCAEWAHWAWIVYRSPDASRGLADAADRYLSLTADETSTAAAMQSAAWDRYRQDLARRYGN
jgi:hypothetical protein